MKEIHEQPKAVLNTINSTVFGKQIDLSVVELSEEEIILMPFSFAYLNVARKSAVSPDRLIIMTMPFLSITVFCTVIPMPVPHASVSLPGLQLHTVMPHQHGMQIHMRQYKSECYFNTLLLRKLINGSV